MRGRLSLRVRRVGGAAGLLGLALGWVTFASAGSMASETGTVSEAKGALLSAIGRYLGAIEGAGTNRAKEVRQRYISEAVAAAMESGGASVIQDRALDLAGFKEDDFSPETARLLIAEIGHTNIANGGQIFLWGVIGRGATNTEIRRLAEEWKREWPRWKADADADLHQLRWNLDWYAVLAMARQGEPWAIKAVLEFVRSPRLTLHDKAPLLLDHLGWIRQPESVGLLREFVNSDEIVGDPVEELDIACALWVYAADALSNCLEDFPYSLLAEDDSKCIPFNKGGVREFMNSHRGPWRIKGRPWPPKEAAGSRPEGTGGPAPHATNGPSGY